MAGATVSFIESRNASGNIVPHCGRKRGGKGMKKKEVVITTIIGRDAECNGDFNSESSVRVDGCINGNVTVADTLIIGATGSINGDIFAKSAVVGGEVNGNISVSERVELTSTARLMGDIVTTLIVIDEKAIFQGRCDMTQEISGKRPKPNAKSIRASRKNSREAISEALKDVESTDVDVPEISENSGATQEM